MSKDVELKESKMRILFRVVTRVNVVLFESDTYPAAEQFCWDAVPTTPSDELHIEKVWVPK